MNISISDQTELDKIILINTQMSFQYREPLIRHEQSIEINDNHNIELYTHTVCIVIQYKSFKIPSHTSQSNDCSKNSALTIRRYLQVYSSV